MLLPKKK
jgi:hypothetical protein